MERIYIQKDICIKGTYIWKSIYKEKIYIWSRYI